MLLVLVQIHCEKDNLWSISNLLFSWANEIVVCCFLFSRFLSRCKWWSILLFYYIWFLLSVLQVLCELSKKISNVSCFRHRFFHIQNLLLQLTPWKLPCTRPCIFSLDVTFSLLFQYLLIVLMFVIKIKFLPSERFNQEKQTKSATIKAKESWNICGMIKTVEILHF